MNFSRTISVKVGTVTCTVTSTAAMLIRCARLLPDPAKSDAIWHWFDILLPALIALRSVAHTALYSVLFVAFAYKFAHTNLFSLWNRFSHFLALVTLRLWFFVWNSFPPTMLAAAKLAEWETFATALPHACLSSFFFFQMVSISYVFRLAVQSNLQILFD